MGKVVVTTKKDEWFEKNLKNCCKTSEQNVKTNHQIWNKPSNQKTFYFQPAVLFNSSTHIHNDFQRHYRLLPNKYIASQLNLLENHCRLDFIQGSIYSPGGGYSPPQKQFQYTPRTCTPIRGVWMNCSSSTLHVFCLYDIVQKTSLLLGSYIGPPPVQVTEMFTATMNAAVHTVALRT